MIHNVGTHKCECGTGFRYGDQMFPSRLIGLPENVDLGDILLVPMKENSL